MLRCCLLLCNVFEFPQGGWHTNLHTTALFFLFFGTSWKPQKRQCVDATDLNTNLINQLDLLNVLLKFQN